MKIEIAANDLVDLRGAIAMEFHRLSTLPVVTGPIDPTFKATQKSCLEEMIMLKKVHKKLSLACIKAFGHSCNPETLTLPEITKPERVWPRKNGTKNPLKER